MNNIKSIIDKYEMVKDKRMSGLVDFENGTRPFLVCTDFPNSFVSNCNSIEQIRGIRKPDISQGRMFAMVMDAINYFKEKTAGQLPPDDQIGAAFGGVAIHSCGNWGHTMPLVAKMKNLYMIDCTISYQLKDFKIEGDRQCRDRTF